LAGFWKKFQNINQEEEVTGEKFEAVVEYNIMKMMTRTVMMMMMMMMMTVTRRTKEEVRRMLLLMNLLDAFRISVPAGS
jgi:hypothetical protein